MLIRAGAVAIWFIALPVFADPIDVTDIASASESGLDGAMQSFAARVQAQDAPDSRGLIDQG